MRIYVTSGMEIDKLFEFRGETVSVGRSSENDIQLKDNLVSRNHLKITMKDERWFLQDLNSRNGTFVDGEQIPLGTQFEVSEGLPVVLGMSVLSLGKRFSDKILTLYDSPQAARNEDAPHRPEERKVTAQRNMELIYKVCLVLTESIGVKESLEKILDSILDLLLRIDRGMIILVGSGMGEVKEVVSTCRKGVDDLGYNKDIVDWVLHFKEACIIPDAEARENEFSETLKLTKIKSVMCVPLICRSRIKGVLYVDSVNKPYGFRGEDVYLLRALSSPIAMAIENAVLAASGKPLE